MTQKTRRFVGVGAWQGIANKTSQAEINEDFVETVCEALRVMQAEATQDGTLIVVSMQEVKPTEP